MTLVLTPGTTQPAGPLSVTLTPNTVQPSPQAAGTASASPQSPSAVMPAPGTAQPSQPSLGSLPPAPGAPSQEPVVSTPGATQQALPAVIGTTPTPVLPGGVSELTGPPGNGSVDGSLCDKDCCEKHHWTFFVDGTAYLLKPYFENNAAFTTTTGIGSTRPFQTESDFGWDYSVSPALTVGILAPGGLGLRAKYFEFDEGSSTLRTSLTLGQAATSSISAAPGVGVFPGATFGSPGTVLAAGLGTDVLNFVSHLKIHSLDGEAMQRWDVGRFTIILSGGGRYLELEQRYSATLENNATLAGGGTVSELQSLNFNQRFVGGGPTIGAEGHVRLGKSGLGLFANARGTLLVGTTHQSNTLVQVVTDPTGVIGGSSTLAPTIDNRRDHVLPVGEIELGLEYCCHRFHHVEPYLRAAVVDMTYFDAGNASRQDGNLSLFGGQATFGVKF
jgi:hypothetical protein